MLLTSFVWLESGDMTDPSAPGRAMRTERAAPNASMLIESMRDIGYSLDSALADIIDNSITAKAKRIDLLIDTVSPTPKLAVIDDGIGMTETELLDAMRPGSRSPLETRATGDLGRFGLGLKTASFSQCRRLTVISRRQGKTAGARWDLDEVARANDWLVELLDEPIDVPWIDRLGENGTLVLWEKMDRLLDRGTSDRSDLVRRIDEATSHIELVFHRYIRGERGLKKIAIYLNGRLLAGFDPFASDHPATQSGAIEPIQLGGHKVEVQAFTLPHHKKVTASEWTRLGGREGYLRNQGFYVYRNKRLIMHGTWFGLARQMELTKLARVRIDMPAELDADWKIDVKKASAQPPLQVRARLRRIIDHIGATSKRVYTARGRALATDSRLPVWLRVQEKNEIRYQLNPEHPVFVDFVSRLPADLMPDFHRVLETASSAMPVDALFADVSGSPEHVSGGTLSDDALLHAATTTFDTLSASGISRDDIFNMMQATEPFRSEWDHTRAMLDRHRKDNSGE